MWRGAGFYRERYGLFLGSGITLDQLYTTSSYVAHDLTGIDLTGNDLIGANFTGQNLANAYLIHTTLTDADFTNAEVRVDILSPIPLPRHSSIRRPVTRPTIYPVFAYTAAA